MSLEFSVEIFNKRSVFNDSILEFRDQIDRIHLIFDGMDLLLSFAHSISKLIDSDILQLCINSLLRCQDTLLSLFYLFELSLFTRRHSSSTFTHKSWKSCLDTTFIN